jgi:hypothetical protein
VFPDDSTERKNIRLPNNRIDSYVSNRAASRHGLKRRSCVTLAMKKIIKRLAIILASLVALLVAVWMLLVWKESPRGHLPWSARNVHVASKSYGVQGWTYCLKAELPEEDFLKFVTRRRATHYSTNPHLNYQDGHDIHWQGGAPSDWWNPSSIKTNTYGRPNGMGLDIMKYENGHLYYKSTGS